MNTIQPTPADVLRQIAQIARMEPGKLCVMREGKSGPYYNHQYRQDGRSYSVYVPRDQVETVREHTENYQRCTALMDEYLRLKVEQTRAGGQDKKKQQATHGKRKRRNSKA